MKCVEQIFFFFNFFKCNKLHLFSIDFLLNFKKESFFHKHSSPLDKAVTKQALHNKEINKEGSTKVLK